MKPQKHKQPTPIIIFVTVAALLLVVIAVAIYLGVNQKPTLPEDVSIPSGEDNLDNLCWTKDEKLVNRKDSSCAYPIEMDEKPVIYLYPEHEQPVSVRLNYDGKIFASYPEYKNGGWQVTARPDGTIIHNDKEYSYLFWEGAPASERTYDLSTGFVVKGSETREFLEQKLSEIGLTPKEYNEFIVYWYPKMQNSAYNLIHFATPDEYDKYAELTITPKPDSTLRIFMTYKPLSAPISVVPQTFPPFSRQGFTIVEWGGTKL